MEGDKLGQTFQAIDIREIVASKNSKVAKRIPSFIYNWLIRILHLKEINAFLKEFGHLTGTAFIDQVIKTLNIHFELMGEENIPQKGRYMFVSNHPLGGLDGVLLLKLLNEKAGSTKVIINDFLMAITPLKHYFVPVNKVGGQARDSIQFIDKLYNSNNQILIFPAGLCSRKIKNKIVDLKWQKHFIQKAVSHKLDIVPIYFGGRNTNKFYNLAILRKFFKIKFNIEMMFLADELYKHQNKTFKIYFGKPLPYSTFNKSKKPIEWARIVKEKVYQLGKSS